MKNVLKFTPILAALSLALTACWPAQNYDKNGISFSYPGGWTIGEEEFYDSRGYLSLAKEGSDPEATVIFGWLATDMQLVPDLMLSGIFMEMQSAGSLADLAADPAVDTTYGPYPARAISYTATVDGTPVAGTVWVFKDEGRIVNVAVREGTDGANAAAFEKMKDSFRLK